VEQIKLLKALGDETRIRILQQLLDGEKCACVIVPGTGKSQPTVSGHLKVLEEAGVLGSRRVGKNVWYAIKSEEAKKVLETLNVRPLKVKEDC
jgi:ArsR family transcriptional regulator, arsenate/arsenite/antimonite-responsive transcriptional repressor